MEIQRGDIDGFTSKIYIYSNYKAIVKSEAIKIHPFYGWIFIAS